MLYCSKVFSLVGQSVSQSVLTWLAVELLGVGRWAHHSAKCNDFHWSSTQTGCLPTLANTAVLADLMMAIVCNNRIISSCWHQQQHFLIWNFFLQKKGTEWLFSQPLISSAAGVVEKWSLGRTRTISFFCLLPFFMMTFLFLWNTFFSTNPLNGGHMFFNFCYFLRFHCCRNYNSSPLSFYCCLAASAATVAGDD